MKKLLCLQLLMLSIFVRAQNLVPNSSFEIYGSCPDDVSELSYIDSWFQPTAGSTDYFNRCDTIHTWGQHIIVAGVPNNFAGSQEPHTGQAYTGIYLMNDGQDIYREYLEVKLVEALAKGRKYRVQFYFCTADSGKMAVKNLGAYFSKDSLTQLGWSNLSVNPQVKYDGDFIGDTSNWTVFNESFIGNGGERFFVLGNFDNNTETQFIYWDDVSELWTDIAYIYVDDVSVTPDTSTEEMILSISSQIS